MLLSFILFLLSFSSNVSVQFVAVKERSLNDKNMNRINWMHKRENREEKEGNPNLRRRRILNSGIPELKKAQQYLSLLGNRINITERKLTQHVKDSKKEREAITDKINRFKIEQDDASNLPNKNIKAKDLDKNLPKKPDCDQSDELCLPILVSKKRSDKKSKNKNPRIKVAISKKSKKKKESRSKRSLNKTPQSSQHREGEVKLMENSRKKLVTTIDPKNNVLIENFVNQMIGSNDDVFLNKL